MQEIGNAAEFVAAGRKLVRYGEFEIAVFAIEGEWFAYENRCPHAGGPVCEGRIMPKVEVEVEPGGALGNLHFSEDIFHLACPWHGWEFDIRTGASASDSRRRLRKFKIEEREGRLYVTN